MDTAQASRQRRKVLRAIQEERPIPEGAIHYLGATLHPDVLDDDAAWDHVQHTLRMLFIVAERAAGQVVAEQPNRRRDVRVSIQITPRT